MKSYSMKNLKKEISILKPDRNFSEKYDNSYNLIKG